MFTKFPATFYFMAPNIDYFVNVLPTDTSFFNKMPLSYASNEMLSVNNSTSVWPNQGSVQIQVI